jgi:NADH-quinone oxidoreductase subunit N
VSSITLESVLALAPEIGLLILAIMVLLFEKGFRPENRRGLGILSAWGTFIILLVTVGLWLFFDQPSMEPASYWGGMIRQDMVTLVFRVMFLIVLLTTILISLDFPGVQRAEYYALLMTATMGFSLMAAGSDLIMIYVALETAGISLYILAAFTTKVYRTSESGMKYFIYGAFATAIMLFGMSYVFGLTQETNIYALAGAVQDLIGNDVLEGTLLIAASLVIVGFGFKISAVPYHFWAPDVYEGAPTPVTGLVSTASKAAGFAVFLRVFTAGVFGRPDSSSAWWAMLVAMCIVTMTLGNLLAIRQKNIKRMLAYSSIGQAGYAMMGLIAALTTAGFSGGSSLDGASATMYFLLYYVVTNVAAFGVVILVSNISNSDQIQDLAGLSRRSPWLALAMMLALLSLGGIPPTAGFFGKFFIFRATVEADLWWLALIGIINAFIALYYYLSVIKVMYLYRSDEEQIRIPISRSAALAIGFTIFAVIYVGILADSTFEWTQRAASAFFIG